MRRERLITPGWDCWYGDCVSAGCPGRRGRSGHGISGETWRYVVGGDDRLTAFVLTVYTDIYPPTIPRSHFSGECACLHPWHDGERCVMYAAPGMQCTCTGRSLHERRWGADITFHVGFPTRPDEVDAFVADRQCEYLLPGFCNTDDSSAIMARDFWRAHGDPRQADQPEKPFWESLSALWFMRDKAARENDMRTPSLGGRLGSAAQVVWDQIAEGQISTRELEILVLMARQGRGGGQ